MKIKFKAWDSENKRMYSAEEVFNDKGEFWYEARPDGSVELCQIIDSYGMRKYFYMFQYTGLEDKNNKEVYEGDIVKIQVFDGWFDNGEHKQFCNYEVKWSNIDVGWRGFTKQMNVEAYNGVPLIGVIEVVGNIFENPKLLDFDAKQFVEDIHKRIGYE